MKKIYEWISCKLLYLDDDRLGAARASAFFLTGFFVFFGDAVFLVG
jgi:hypothetical protein